MQPDPSQQPPKKVSLAEFSRHCVMSDPVHEWISHINSRYPNFYYTVMQQLLPFKERFLLQTQKFIDICNEFSQYDKQDYEHFKTHSSTEYAGSYAFLLALFLPAIVLLGNQKQVDHWMKLCMDHRVTASYCQTEITHGSDVQNLQTTAHFDPKKKCFILNTPNLGAVKYWPGGLGIIATHIITQAQLYVNGKHYGLQTFVIQIRDYEKMQPIKGIEVGDIGPKLGFKNYDNGYLILKDYEAPLDSLLQKYIQVDQNGNVTQEKDKDAQKLTYGAMMNLRSIIVRLFTHIASRALAISHLLKSKSGYSPAEGRAWLDTLGIYWALVLSSQFIYNTFDEFSRHYKSDPKLAIKMIKELHFLTSGAKVFSSWFLVKAGRVAAANCPTGHLILSGFTQLYADGVPTTTYEGDNVVLSQQVMQVALVYFNRLRGGKDIIGVADFLNRFKKYAQEDLEYKEKFTIENTEDLMLHCNDILDVFAYKYLVKCAKLLQKAIMEDGLSLKVATAGKLQNELVELGISIFHVVMTKMAAKTFLHEETIQMLHEKDYELVAGLLRLYELNLIRDMLGLILENEVIEFNPKLNEIIDQAKEELYQGLLPNLEYLSSHWVAPNKEISTTENFKDLSNPHYDSLRAQIEAVAKQINGAINRQSRL